MRLDQYDERYVPALKNTLADKNITPLIYLPGIAAPTASALLHFMLPDEMPIMDVRTLDVLLEDGWLAKPRRGVTPLELMTNCVPQ